MKTKYNTISITRATYLNYRPVTDSYNTDELEMLDKALLDFQGIDHILVQSFDGIAIYRKASEVDIVKNNP